MMRPTRVNKPNGIGLQRKRARIRLQPLLQKARTEIPPLVAEVSLSFMASLCTPVHEEN
jgi:hypothetical protein